MQASVPATHGTQDKTTINWAGETHKLNKPKVDQSAKLEMGRSRRPTPMSIAKRGCLQHPQTTSLSRKVG